jgi:hypothetical protein
MSSLQFDIFSTLVVDLMHEIELGVWKQLYTHLIRILQAVNPILINELDRRYVFGWMSLMLGF